MATYVETTAIEVPLDQRRHYLALTEKLRQLLAPEQGVARFLVLEDREKLGKFVEIIEYASAEEQATLAADGAFRARLSAIDREIESLVPAGKRERRVMVDRL